jgi:aryl-alcohol dehydrogenase-like predicted oxidoreductase
MIKTQRPLGETGQYVTAIGLGGMPMSLQGRPDEIIAMQVIETFIEGGGNFIDTANVYCKDETDIGHNERLIHKALIKLSKRDDMIVATKGGLTRPKGGWEVDASPQWLRKSCEKSLQDLNTDCIFLYQLHAPDPCIPLTDSLGELVRLREEGKIRYIGLSNVNVREIEIALTITPITSVQNRCNIFEKQSFQNGVADLCDEKGITFIPHSPVGGHFNHVKVTQTSLLNKLAGNYGVSPYQIVLAWLLQRGEHIIPIPGASKASSIADSIKALDVKLEQDDIDSLDQLTD